jgi:hypothetical protein
MNHLPKATTEARTAQLKIVAQGIEQGHVWIVGVDCHGLPVDVQRHGRRHRIPPGSDACLAWPMMDLTGDERQCARRRARRAAAQIATHAGGLVSLRAFSPAPSTTQPKRAAAAVGRKPSPHEEGLQNNGTVIQTIGRANAIKGCVTGHWRLSRLPTPHWRNDRRIRPDQGNPARSRKPWSFSVTPPPIGCFRPTSVKSFDLIARQPIPAQTLGLTS